MEKKNEKEIIIKIEGADWEKLLDDAFKKANRKAKIAGFRPGKAPKSIFIKDCKVPLPTVLPIPPKIGSPSRPTWSPSPLVFRIMFSNNWRISLLLSVFKTEIISTTT